ncbi:MAG: hypothetical protein JXQ71_02305, partial [Verrucomicrobia bacterium]|nr:hypothetical protein [Verrucomicrobiota bacterium]
IVFFFTTNAPPTPRGPNAGSTGPQNTPPALAEIPNMTVTLGQTLGFTATATDPDVPPQTLSFSLDGVVAEGASITTAGDFTWTPTAAQAPGTSTFVVRVSDNGVPPGSDTETFDVMVVLPPETVIRKGTGGQVSLVFGTAPGQHYRVEYTDSLASPIAWSPLPGAESLSGSGGSLEVTDTPDPAHPRFYRIVLLE